MPLKIYWTNSKGERCERIFRSHHDRILFAERLYLENYDKYGKISTSRPTLRALDAAIVWAKGGGSVEPPRK